MKSQTLLALLLCGLLTALTAGAKVPVKVGPAAQSAPAPVAAPKAAIDTAAKAPAPAVHKPSADTVVMAKTGSDADPVRLSHKAHAAVGVACVTCHHKKGNDARVKQCAKCHQGEKAKDTLHGKCVGCHTLQKKGPQEDSCEACHQPAKK
jgi:hypothetical protein